MDSQANLLAEKLIKLTLGGVKWGERSPAQTIKSLFSEVSLKHTSHPLAYHGD